LIIDSCIIIGNAGGVSSWSILEGWGALGVYNSIIAYNGERGVVCSSGASLGVANSTIVGHTTAGISRSINGGVVYNCIVWGNGDDLYNVTSTYSDIQDGDPGQGNISADPLFLDPANDDYHLTLGSPCIDSGRDRSFITDDFEGDPRPLDGDLSGTAEYDMGADEFNYEPYGHLDGVSATKINGWGYDPDAGMSPIDVQIYFDGVAGSGTLATTVSANLYRPDVPVNVPSVQGEFHGFRWDPTGFIESQGYTAGSVHPVYVYLVNQPAGTNPLLGTGSITVAGTNQDPYGSLGGVSATKIFGWGYDPDAGTSPIDVQVYFDGVAESGTLAATVTANLYRPDVPINVPSVQGDYHGFSWDPTGFIESQGYAPGSVHDVYVYLVNYPAGTNPLLGTGTITVP
jgi:hypothetical protein